MVKTFHKVDVLSVGGNARDKSVAHGVFTKRFTSAAVDVQSGDRRCAVAVRFQVQPFAIGHNGADVPHFSAKFLLGMSAERVKAERHTLGRTV